MKPVVIETIGLKVVIMVHPCASPVSSHWQLGTLAAPFIGKSSRL